MNGMDMNKLDALAIAARDLLRDHSYVKSITVTALKENDGIKVEANEFNADGTFSRIVHSGEAPF